MPDTLSNQKLNNKKPIDGIDSKMISLLQKDGRISNIDMAKQLGISEATVRTRLKRLMDEGFIQIVAVSNPFRLGFEITGDLYIHVEMKKADDVIKELKKIKALWYIVMTTGDNNINAEFVVKTLEDLNDLVYNRVSHIDGVIRVETSVIMKYVKRNYAFGTALDG
ncbi:MAG: Lrp/AsnC family transcriptional regulator [Deltaproteobacteria bacterium]|nr:Lrp/AsnC family transcriptional regulator [Deltaproteobacteria bacterium]MBW2365008.1 Lrp/AsnC family transcriptional regulator [Deltaproteobacteria bacterium]